MRDYPNVPCSICFELIDPGSAFWYPTEQETFTDYGQPFDRDELEPLCEDCTLRLLIDRDAPRHSLPRPRPADSL